MATPKEEKKQGLWDRIVSKLSKKQEAPTAQEKPQAQSAIEPSVGPPP